MLTADVLTVIPSMVPRYIVLYLLVTLKLVCYESGDLESNAKKDPKMANFLSMRSRLNNPIKSRQI